MLWYCSLVHLLGVPEPGNTGSLSQHSLIGVACTGTLCPGMSVGTASLCLPDGFFSFFQKIQVVPAHVSQQGALCHLGPVPLPWRRAA